MKAMFEPSSGWESFNDGGCCVQEKIVVKYKKRNLSAAILVLNPVADENKKLYTNGGVYIEADIQAGQNIRRNKGLTWSCWKSSE